jgi:PAS domain-containing protein
MRQWELVGITDTEPGWRPDIVLEEASVDEPSGTFFWSTDVALTFRVVSDAAGEAIGLDPWHCEGRDLLAVFGIEGTNLAILEAHTEALQGGEGRFTLDCEGRRVRCRVEPTHAGDGRVIGTFCLAIADDPEEPARRAFAAAAA